MKSIMFHNLVLSEAEDLIIAIWMLLEKHQLATPRLASHWTGGRLALEFTFESEAQRVFVEYQARALRKRAHRASIVGSLPARAALPRDHSVISPEPVSREGR